MIDRVLDNPRKYCYWPILVCVISVIIRLIGKPFRYTVDFHFIYTATQLTGLTLGLIGIVFSLCSTIYFIRLMIRKRYKNDYLFLLINLFPVLFIFYRILWAYIFY